ncbi:CLN3 protein [Tritrichomonas foetus]|uniref:CLN3 protein n=1 Tax=Tritrichomonas foetus TaxID=1144522 RepID=A0A1J4JQH9_9EUKA|nr:CLN3 protein [Tritrichomonas foetus]|eukprot:OHT00672.1 CLN3 protein [Tritrichomonas foetus]
MAEVKEQLNPTISEDELKAVSTDNKVVKHYIGMLIIGALNNLPYWVAISSAQSIVMHFNSEGMLGAITWACVLLGMAATSINTFLSAKNVSYNIRSIANGCFMGFGLIGTAFAPNIYVAMIGIAFVGLSSDFGEGVMLGYFASIADDSLMGAWGVGTGISGCLGAGYAFIVQFFSISYFTSFLALSPSGILYPLAFIFLLDAKSPKKEPKSNKAKTQKSKTKEIDPEMCDEIVHDINELDVIPEELSDEEEDEEKVKCCTVKLWKYTAYFFINNAITFFSQYASISGLTDCAMTAQEKIEKPYIYGLLSLIYQAGNMAGRSTLKFFKIKRIWILTTLQFIFFLVMFVNVQFKFLPIWGKIVAMILVGVNSGLSYVNLFNQVMNYPQANMKEREIMTNLTTISIAGFIVVSSAFTLLIQNTFFKSQCQN